MFVPIIINLLGSQYVQCLCFVTEQKIILQQIKKGGRASDAPPPKSASENCGRFNIIVQHLYMYLESVLLSLR